MKAKRISIFVSLAMLIVLVSAVPVAAQTERIAYTGTVCITSLEGGYEWTEGNVYHQRNVLTSGIVTASIPEYSGDVTIIQNLDINQLTGDVHAFGTVELYPAGYDGSWVGHFSTHVFGGILRGSGTTIGTGELEGMINFNDMSNPAIFNPLCYQGGTGISGSIMITP